MPKNPLENTRTDSVEMPGPLSDREPNPNVIKDIRNFAPEASMSSAREALEQPKPSAKETSTRRSNSFPYRHMTEDGRIVEVWIEVKSKPKQTDHSSNGKKDVGDSRSTKPSPREISREDLPPDQQRIYDYLPPEYQREPALKEVLMLRGKREHDISKIEIAEQQERRYKFIENSVNKEIDYFKKEYISAVVKKGDKLSRGQKELSLAEGFAAYDRAEATGSAGYGKVDQSKAMFTDAAVEIYEKSAAAHEAVRTAHSRLLDYKTHLGRSQSAYEKAKDALSQQQRKSLSEAKARANSDIGQGEKKLANTTNSDLEQELTAMRTRLRDGIAAAKKVLSEAEDKR